MEQSDLLLCQTQVLADMFRKHIFYFRVAGDGLLESGLRVQIDVVARS